MPTNDRLPTLCDVEPILPIDIARLIETRLLVQANSGGGKSWALRRLLEVTYGHVQHLVLDPDGEYHTLRQKFDYVLAGTGGDCPAEVKSAKLLARRLLELGVSAIIDISELGADRAAFVEAFLESLMDAPRELWHPVMVVIDEAHKFCLSEDTELLTNNGWRRHDQIDIGTVAVAFDIATATYRYEALTDVVRFHHSGHMQRLRSDGIDCLVTDEHRVVCRRLQRANGRYGKFYDWTFVEASKLPKHVYVPIGGAPSGAGVTLSDDMIRLIGWITTDGSFTGGHAKRYLSVSQAYCTTKLGRKTLPELESLMHRLGGRTKYDRPARGKSSPAADFYLGVALSREVIKWTGEQIHRVPRQLIEKASRSQLEILWEAMMLGDGTSHNGRWTTFYAGYNEGIADDFQELSLRLGVSASKRRVPQSGQWVVHLSQRKHHYIRKLSQPVEYRGTVWCVTLPAGAFVARRDGKVFVTGNCAEGDRKATAHAAVVDLMSRGRKRGFCGVLATQRISKLDKSAAAEVNNKLIGRTGLDVDVDRAGKELGLNLKNAREELPYLSPGEFWAVGPALAARPTLVKIGQVATTHPKAGARGGPPTPPRGDFKKALAEQLANLPAEAEAEAKTVEELRKRVRELEATGGGAEVERLEKMVQVLVQERDIARAKLEDIERVELANDGLLEEVSRGIDESIDRLTALRNRIPEALEEAAKTSNGSRVFFGAVPPPDMPQPRRVEVRSSDGEVAWVDPKKLTISQGADLSAMERAFLTVLAQWRETYTSAMPKHKVLLYADYSAGGATSKCFAKMTKAGWIAPDGAGSVRITSSGLGALGSYEPLPTGEDLYRHILNGSRLSTMEKELLSRIWEVRREGAIGKGEVLKRAGYAAGGATSKAFARLVALDYCVNTGGGKICVADDLWKRRDV